MKNLVVFLLFVNLNTFAQISSSKTENVFVVTIDGIRWQEIFKGADEDIINDSRFTSNPGLSRLMYYDSSATESRKKLLPFFWNVIQNKGRLYGNKQYDNKLRVANSYKFSYPGYNEMLTGYPDIHVNSNEKIDNVNINVLEFLNSFDEFKNRVVAFTSWNIFPYILNKSRSGFPLYSGYDSIDHDGNINIEMFNKLQEYINSEKTDTREDKLTFIAAFQYIKAHKPKVAFISLGESDEDAHAGQYDKYLQHLNEADNMIQALWYFIQSVPEYKDKTTILITTDHGRGRRSKKWTDHDIMVKGSGDAWLAIIGPDTVPGGEIQLPQKHYQKQIAATIANLLGYHFIANHPVAKPIDFTN
ncbi:MAG: hypothetical protein ABIR19_09810 [Ginsengibacter sp.]